MDGRIKVAGILREGGSEIDGDDDGVVFRIKGLLLHLGAVDLLVGIGMETVQEEGRRSRRRATSSRGRGGVGGGAVVRRWEREGKIEGKVGKRGKERRETEREIRPKKIYG